MRELLDQLGDWWAQGTRFAVATVVGVSGSAPRQPGASMALSELGEVLGSISGGCVEATVHEAAKHVLDDGDARLLHFGPDDELGEPGLTCGGSLDVVVHLCSPSFPALLQAVERGRPVALATVVGGSAVLGEHLVVTAEEVHGSVGDEAVDAALTLQARGRLAMGTSGLDEAGQCDAVTGERVTVFVESFAPAPKMLVFGSMDYAAALASLGRFLGYHVTICDARATFTTQERFPHADEVVVCWPHDLLARTEVDERTVICVLTHDPKFDLPVLVAALATPAAFVGALGSRRTHADRVVRLRAAGVTEQQLARLSSPIGLDLGGRTPEETAVAIAAEIVALRWGGSGSRLSDVSTPIHA